MSSSPLELISAAVKSYQDTKDQLTKTIKTNLEKGLKEILETNPLIESVRWYGWTPSFNDGDPCYFHFDETPREITDTSGEVIDVYDNEVPSINTTIEELYNAISVVPEEILEEIYGENFCLELSREGLSSRYYDCGY